MRRRHQPDVPVTVVVYVTPPGQNEVGWRMKPGDAVTVDWPGDNDLTVTVDGSGAVRVAGVAKAA